MQNAKEHALAALHQGKDFIQDLLVALLTGAICGVVGSLFHLAVDWATEIRMEHNWLLYLLPVAGLVIAALYHLTKTNGIGTNNILNSIRKGDHIPLWLVPVIFASTTITHLFGGSAGREGAALQIGGGIGFELGKLLRLDESDMRMVTLCGMSAVFAALFATPLTATVFVLEVVAVGMIQYSAFVPCLVSSVGAFGISKLFGLHTSHYAPVVQGLDAVMFGKVAVFAVIVALASILLCEVLHNTEHAAAKLFKNRFVRAVVGGVLLIGMTLVLNTRDYNGAGGDIITLALGGTVNSNWAFLWKLIFTAVTIGFGFKGGEIVPTFFIGATFGCVIGPMLGIPAELAAALGLVGMFCGVVNCPLASIFLSIELFGAGAMPYFALVCGIAYMLSGKFGLYTGSQMILYPKTKWVISRQELPM
ncbi:MAG: chloride channel protein [Clostridia bacterium]|nr:chloride channel protein [Clostridia bacterium]